MTFLGGNKRYWKVIDFRSSFHDGWRLSKLSAAEAAICAADDDSESKHEVCTFTPELSGDGICQKQATANNGQTTTLFFCIHKHTWPHKLFRIWGAPVFLGTPPGLCLPC